MRDALSLRPRDPSSEGWEPLDGAAILRAPDAFGVCEIANSRKERILVFHGAIREQLQRVLLDPLARDHDARFFRIHVTLTDRQAEQLQTDLLRAYVELGLPRPFVGGFPMDLGRDKPARTPGHEK